MKSILTIISIVLFGAVNLFAQCDCPANLSVVAHQLESVHPSFKKGSDKTSPAYLNWKKDYTDKAGSTSEITECLELINGFLKYIKDGHLSVFQATPQKKAKIDNWYETTGLPVLDTLDDKTHYIKARSFNMRLWREWDAFYVRVDDLIDDRPNLIVDIRNNGGGGQRMYNGLIEIIKKKKSIENVVVLYNAGCGSACEEVAMKVSKIEKVTSMGQPTRGAFAYGNIYYIKLPSCDFQLVMTSKAWKNRLQYEGVGFPVEITLDKEEDHVAAAIEYLKGKG